MLGTSCDGDLRAFAILPALRNVSYFRALFGGPNGNQALKPTVSSSEAAKHVAEAQSLLQNLRQELDEHPAIEEAILKLEMALSILTTKSGGML